MKMNNTLLVIVIIASVISCHVTADSEEGIVDTKDPVLSAKSSDDRLNERVDPANNGKASNLDKNELRGQLDPKGGEDEQNKVNGSGAQNDKAKGNEGSDSKSEKGSKEERLPLAREECDSSSNRCTDDDKTLVACLRVPGNDSPALSLLIQNKGKGPLSIKISAPNLVELEKKQIDLQENKDTEVKVSIGGVESGHVIVLTAGHGNCSLNFRDQFVARKKVDHSSDSSPFSIFKLTLSTGFLFFAALLIVVVSAFLCAKCGRKYFPRKDLKYQRLDMELPVSQGSKLDPSENEGWDDSWGDSWDDEEAPKTPSLPVTPSISSKGMASRKFKEGWKD